jgi:antitoxin CptB
MSKGVLMSGNEALNNTVTNNENSTNVLKVNKARLKWACRRGMLELDVLFIPFVDEAYDDLSTKDQFTFERLLTCQDPELFAWFMGHEVCEDKELNAVVQHILKRVKV